MTSAKFWGFFTPPSPSSAFHATYHYYLSAKLGNSSTPLPLRANVICTWSFAVNGCSGFATSAQKGPFTAMLISRSRGSCLISFQNSLK